MITPFKPEQIADIARLHTNALKGDFLPSLGIAFLTTFYQSLINEPCAYTLIYCQKRQVKGFIIGTNDMGIFFKNILRKRFFKFSLLITYQILKKPRLLKNVFETLFYTKKESGPKAELVIIAVDQKHRGQGIGKTLIQALEKIFLENRIKQYKVTVVSSKKAVGFYNYLNFRPTSNFSLYGKKWLVFEKNII